MGGQTSEDESPIRPVAKPKERKKKSWTTTLFGARVHFCRCPEHPGTYGLVVALISGGGESECLTQ